MFKRGGGIKYAGLLLLVTFLAACEQKVTATFYLRDVQELFSEVSNKNPTVDLSIEIFESGLVKKCESSEGNDIVNAIASVFEKATLVACEKMSGSFNDRMIIKASTELKPLKSEGSLKDQYLLSFEGEETDDGLILVRANYAPEKYEVLQKRLRRINSMLTIKIENVHLSVNLNNDLRDPIDVIINSGVFLNGQPLAGTGEYRLDVREEANIKLGDVLQTYLVQQHSAVIFGVKSVNNSSTKN